MFFTGKLDRLIDDIERASENEKSVLSRKEYKDTPLVFTASQMKSFTPDRIARFRREFRTRTVYTADPKMFLMQARYMADYEDNYADKAEFSSAFPSYAAMSDAQLRTYFSWRTRLRHGKLEKTSLSYAYVYIFELLNVVGAQSPYEAFEKLDEFFESYGRLDECVLLYRGRWLTDFAVYYGLEELYGKLPEDDVLSAAGAVLLSPETHTDTQIAAAVEEFSSYSLMHSTVYKKSPALCERAVAATVRELNAQFSHSGGFAEHYCRKKKISYCMFASAVVRTDIEVNDRTVMLPDGRTFCCINGHWLKTVFVKDGAVSRDLGALIRTLDIILRDKLKIKNKIKPSPLNLKLQTAVKECVDGVLADIEHESAKKRMESVKIDFSKLDRIRSASDMTGEKLMTDEDTGIPSAATGAPSIFANEVNKMNESNIDAAVKDEICTCDKPDGECEPKNGSPATEKDVTKKENGDLCTHILKILLDGGDPSAEAKRAGVMLSMVCDEINERFFDDFGDTVIDFGGDVPVIISDYAEELRGMIE